MKRWLVCCLGLAALCAAWIMADDGGEGKVLRHVVMFRFKEGTVYPALRKLENAGLIQGQWQQMSGGQERRYYHITEKGKEVLRQKIAMWRNFTAAVDLIFAPSS